MSSGFTGVVHCYPRSGFKKRVLSNFWRELDDEHVAEGGEQAGEPVQHLEGE